MNNEKVISHVVELARMISPNKAKRAHAPGKWVPVNGFKQTEPPMHIYTGSLPHLAASGKIEIPENLLQACEQKMPVMNIPFSQQLATEKDMVVSQYVPSKLAESPGLVLVLHGCLQHSQSYALATGWTELADRRGFILVAPQQTYQRHGMLAFKWFEPKKGQTGWNEAQTIMDMLEKVRQEHKVDQTKVYVTGLSAGGAMTAVMLARFPEKFAGGGILAGLPYACATNEQDAQKIMKSGKSLTPQQWADLVRQADGSPGKWPKISLWQGDRDSIVNPMFLNELMEQWTATVGVDQTPEVDEAVKGYPHKVYLGSGGKAVETYQITGMDHAAPVDPGAGDDRGGDPNACGWVTDANIFSSYCIARFWGLI